MIDRVPTASGRVRAVNLGRPGSAATDWRHNLVLKSWASVVGRLLTTGESKYRVGAMYLEFANVPSPGDVAPVPAFDRNPASGREYYDSLADNATRDYLRVGVISSLTSSDEAAYPDGNLVKFFAQTAGTVGVHGKSFGESYNSVVIGAALVARPSRADATQDIVVSRFYFDEADQQPKLAVGQIGVEWELELQ